jgi:hypothetical protein
MGIYSKVLSYILLIYAGGSRFSHLLYLGWQDILTDLFAVGRLPLASTTLTRLFKKIRKLKEVEEMSEGLWGYLKRLIPWTELKADWLTFDSTVLERYGKQEGVKRGYNPKKKGRGSHSPLLAFLNRSKYVVHLWNRPGNVMSWNNIIGFFESTWHRINGYIDIKGIIADSGFYLREFIELLEKRRLVYIIAARLYHPLQRSSLHHSRPLISSPAEEGLRTTELAENRRRDMDHGILLPTCRLDNRQEVYSSPPGYKEEAACDGKGVVSFRR